MRRRAQYHGPLSPSPPPLPCVLLHDSRPSISRDLNGSEHISHPPIFVARGPCGHTNVSRLATSLEPFPPPKHSHPPPPPHLSHPPPLSPAHPSSSLLFQHFTTAPHYHFPPPPPPDNAFHYITPIWTVEKINLPPATPHPLPLPLHHTGSLTPKFQPPSPTRCRVIPRTSLF